MRYLTKEQLISINKAVVEKYSPLESSRLASPSALNMIVNSPKRYAFRKELYPTLMEKATVLFVQLTKKHIFENANKGATVFALVAFLKLNQIKLMVSTKELVDFTVLIATNPLTDDSFKEYCGWLNERVNR